MFLKQYVRLSMCLSISLTQSYREVKYKLLSLLKTIKWNWWGVRGEEVFNFLLYMSELMFYSSKSCPIPCDPMDCSLPGSSVPGILQGRILEWVAMPSSRGSSQPRVRTEVSHIAGGFFTIWATKEAQECYSG